MNCHKVLLAMFLLIVVTSPSFSERLALQPFSQESDRDRTRDAWQRPAEVFDAMAVKPGHRVADIGSGSGYFTFRLAAKVGAEGKVYAVDIEQKAIDKVRQRQERERLEQVEAILGESNDPHLPNDLDSVLIVDSYHEFREFDRMMQAVFRALKPAGRLVIIDAESPSGRPRTEYHRLHSIPADIVLEELRRNGFVFKESWPGFYDAEYGKKMYFLVFEKPESKSPEAELATKAQRHKVTQRKTFVSASRPGGLVASFSQLPLRRDSPLTRSRKAGATSPSDAPANACV